MLGWEGLKSNDWFPYKRQEIQRHGEDSCVKLKAWIGMSYLQAEGCQEWLLTTRKRQSRICGSMRASTILLNLEFKLLNLGEKTILEQ